MTKRKCLILLSAGKISNKLPHIFTQNDCPALYPLGNKFILFHQLDFYKKYLNDVFILTNKRFVSKIQNEIKYFSNLNIKLLYCNTKSVNDTLKFALKNIDLQLFNECIVSVVTTIPNYFPKKNEVLFDKQLKTIQNWSAIKKTNDNYKYFNLDNRIPIKANAFTGVFNFNLKKLNQIVKKNKSKDLIDIVHSYDNKYSLKIKKIDWFDVGHSANYFNTKIKFFSSRAFNKISFNKEKGIIEKSSKNINKLSNEFKFIYNLPPEIKSYYPQVISKIKFKKQIKVSMDYCPFPNVSELQLFWKMDNSQWLALFDSIENYLTECNQYKENYNRNKYINFHLNKLNLRLSEFKKNLKKKYYFLFDDDFITINNKKLFGLNKIFKYIKNTLNNNYCYPNYAIMHGDLCFNNILYDPITEKMKLIDPRGSFENNSSIFGDQKYDISKLIHSSVYGYDYLISDLYDLEINNKKINYKIHFRENHDFLIKISNNLIKKFNYNINEINFFTGMLFLTMPPLHYESLKKQIIMFSIGVEIINNCLNND